ncbi:MAG: AAA family ATPase [Clostridia bacterium]
MLFDDEKSIIRLDMSEYSEAHSISKLIGSPPGYVRI